tara:strand:+ start:4055 stop:5086 length:1032 start_codon:yes stop_codon:yes gene_type:complete
MKKKVQKNQEKILVTGGSGFIGSNLINYLLKLQRFKILNLDKLTYASNKKFINSNSKNYIFKKIDICNIKNLQKAIITFKPSKIIHLAAESHVDRSIKNRNNFIKTNFLGTFNMAELSLSYWQNLDKHKKKKFKFLYVSTDEVYGDNYGYKNPFTEDHKFETSSAYSATKAGAELLVLSYFKTFGLPIIISRSSNNFGFNQNREKFIPMIVYSIFNSKSVGLYGDGMQIRNWIYVEDNIIAMVKLLFKGKVGEAYNISGKNSLKNYEIVNLIYNYMYKKKYFKKKVLDKKRIIKYIPDRLGHDKKYAISSKKIYNDIKWQPVMNFKKMLYFTIDKLIEKEIKK